MRAPWRIPELTPLLQGADHVDVKIVEGAITLRAFLAGLAGYQPGWVTALFGGRRVFVRLLGMRQPGMPRAARLRPEQVPMQPGAKFLFFTVRLAREDRYWAAEIDDTHLRAALVVVVAPLPDGRNRFYVVTIVHYQHWTGPLYFNVIRPFHHLVVGGMARAGARSARPLASGTR
jgi:hypothetical protein